MTSAALGALAEFKLGSGASPQVYTKVAEVLRIGEIGSVAPEVDVTNLDSTAKEYIGGLPDGASVEIQMNWLASNTQQEDFRDSVGDTEAIQIVWPDSSQADFNLVVLGFNRDETTAESQMTATVSGRITGAITWA